MIIKIFFRSKLFAFLASLFGYLLFVYQLVSNYRSVFYANMPEETIYFKQAGHNMNSHYMYAYLLAACLAIFMIFGLMYLLVRRPQKIINYILIGILFSSFYLVWNYSTYSPASRSWYGHAHINFVVLVLFGFSIFRFGKLRDSN